MSQSKRNECMEADTGWRCRLEAGHRGECDAICAHCYVLGERCGKCLKGGPRAAVEHLMAELLDEAVPAGELLRIVRSVRASLREFEPVNGGSEALTGLCRELAGELLGGGKGGGQ